MDNIKDDLEVFKSKLEKELSKNYSTMLLLLITMLKHIETIQDGDTFLTLVIHSPLLDLENEAKDIYKKILIQNNSKIVTLEDIFHIIKNQNSDIYFKNLHTMLNNIFYTTCLNSPLENKWLFNYASDIYPIVKTMEEIYKERKKFSSDIQLIEKFKNRILLSRKVSVKRKIEEATYNETVQSEKNEKKRKKIKLNDDINKSVIDLLKSPKTDDIILDKINKIEWEEFVKKLMIKLLNDDSVNNILKSKMLEYELKIEKLNKSNHDLLEKYNALNLTSIENEIKTLNDRLINLVSNIVENESKFESVKDIQNDLTKMRKSIRANISASNKSFEKFIERNENEIKTSKNELFNKMNTLSLYIQEMKKKMEHSFTLIETELLNNKNRMETLFDNHKHKMDSIMQIFYTESETKKTDLFDRFTSIKNDVNNRIKEMTNVVREYNTKMSAAMLGNAFSLL